jgi:PAS domain S-box-containing protein
VKQKKPTYQQLESKLAQAEQVIEAIEYGQVDAVMSNRKVMTLRLKEAEQALRDSEQRYRNFVRKNPDATFCLDPEGRFTEVNQATVDISGYREDELLGKDWRDLCSPQDLEKAKKSFQATLAGSSHELQITIVHKNGRELDLHLTAGPLFVRDEIRGVFVIARDLTTFKATEENLRIHQAELQAQNDELRRMQQDLEVSRSKFADLFEFAPVGYFVTDKKGNIEQVNLTGSAILGRPRNTLTQKPFAIYVAKDDRDIFYLTREKVLKTAKHVHADLRMLREGEDEFFANLLIEPVKDAAGEVVRCRIALIDITARVQAQQKLAAKEEQLRLVIRSGHTGTWDWDLLRNEVLCNDILFEMLGLPQNKNKIKPDLFFSRMHRDDRPRVEKNLRKTLKENDEFIDEFRIVTKDNRIRWLASRAKVYRDQNARPVRIMGVNFDITEKKLSEQQLAQANVLRETLLMQAPVGFAYFDLELRYVLINETLAEINGLSAEKHIGKTLGEVVPSLLSDVQKITDTILRTGQPVRDQELSGETAALPGVTRYWNESWYPVRNKDGAIIGFGTVVEEITDRKKAEEALRKSEQKFHSLFNNMSEASVLFQLIRDENGKPVDCRVLDANSAVQNMTGIAPKDALGKTMREIFPDADDFWFRTYGKVEETGEPENFERYFQPLNRSYYVSVYRPAHGQVAIVFTDITQKKKIQQDLQQSEQDLNRAQEVGNIGSWRMDLTKNELTWSDQNYRIFGVPEAEPLTYETFLNTVHPDDRKYVDEKWKAALKGEPYDIEHRIIADGKTKWVREKAFLESDQNGRLIGGYGITQDITELKRILDELTKSRDMLDSRVKERTAELRQANLDLRRQAELLDLAHDTIIVHDLDGRIIFWNKGAETTYGYKKKDVIGKITHEVLKTKYSEPLLKIVSAVSTKGAWEGELSQTAKNGNERIVLSKWALQKDENGKPAAILEIDRDITERKAAEKMIEDARIYAESIIETIEEAILVLDARLRVVSANKTFYRVFSLKPKNIVGKYVYDLANDHWKLPAFRKLLEDILPKNMKIEEYEIEYPGKKGTIHLLLNAKEIFENKGDERRILLAFHDVTSHKLQERALKELTEQLLLAEENQRQQVATALHDSVGQALSFSKWELDRLLKEPNLRTDTRIKRLMNQVNDSIKHTRKLTVDLSSPTLHTFGLKAGLEELAEQFTARNDIKCTVNAAEQPNPLEKRIELLLYRSTKELLHNIKKHAKAENVTIALAEKDGFLEIEVTDDGRGFNTSRLNPNNNKNKSFGLFSIEQRLTNVGGSFNITSKKKKGTTVMLRAPLKKQEDERG